MALLLYPETPVFKSGDLRNEHWPQVCTYSWLVTQIKYVTTMHFQGNKGRIINTTNLKSLRKHSISTKKEHIEIFKLQMQKKSSNIPLVCFELYYIWNTLKSDNIFYRISYLHIYRISFTDRKSMILWIYPQLLPLGVHASYNLNIISCIFEHCSWTFFFGTASSSVMTLRIIIDYESWDLSLGFVSNNSYNSN